MIGKTTFRVEFIGSHHTDFWPITVTAVVDCDDIERFVNYVKSQQDVTISHVDSEYITF